MKTSKRNLLTLQQKYALDSPKSIRDLEELCMTGSIQYRPDRKIFYVSWYNKADGKRYKIYKYHGEYIYNEKVARKLLSLMQGDVEKGIFRIDNYTNDKFSDVPTYLNEWLAAIKHTLKPATFKDYDNSIRNHLIPFFEEKKITLQEIRYDTLLQLMNSIDRAGKGKLNVLYCLHACLDFAWRSQRIPSVPPFPKREQFGLVEPDFKWLPEERQIRILEQLPKEHDAIFWFMKFHMRRWGEAFALYKSDFDGDVFTIHRSFSNRILVDSTKTGDVYVIPCHSDFKPILQEHLNYQKREGLIFSPFLFVNKTGKTKNKPYTYNVIHPLWKEACEKAGEEYIKPYSGTKHSTCTQFLNEKGLSESELMMVTGHKRLESLRHYAKTGIERKRELMERKVVSLQPKTVGGKV